jgi:hypothetical protein
MTTKSRLWRQLTLTGGVCTLLLAFFIVHPGPTNNLEASPLSKLCGCRDRKGACGDDEDGRYVDNFEGAWYWLHSPEQEKRLVMNLYNRYCIRCHGIDGRGVWDIPDVPDFTNAHWQATRTDAQLARAILKGRGTVMPQWRGALSLQESWAMASYIRTFIPGTGTPRPDTTVLEAGKPNAGKPDSSKPKTKKQ